MALAVDNHPQRQQIIDRLLAGEGCRKIATSVIPPLSHTAVYNYRNCKLSPALNGAVGLAKSLQSLQHGMTPSAESQQREVMQVASQVASLAMAADPLLSRIGRRQEQIDNAIAQASDGKEVAALVNADYRGIELHAKLTGRLESAQNVTNIMVVCSAGQAPPAEPEYEGETIDLRPVK